MKTAELLERLTASPRVRDAILAATAAWEVFVAEIVEAAGLGGGDTLVVQPNDGGFSFVRENAEGAREPVPNERVADLRNEARVVLRLNDWMAVRRTITLPTGNPATVAAILRNKIDRLGPWPAGKAVFGFSLAPEGDKQAAVTVAIAGSDNIDRLTAELAGGGIRVDQVEVGAPPIIVTKGVSEFERRIGRRLLRGWVVLNGALAAAVAAMLTLNGMASSELAAVEARFSPAILAAFRSGASQNPAAADVLVARKSELVPSIVVLRELTHALPDTATLDSLNIENGTVSIAGEAQDVPNLIGALHGSRVLRDVAFAAPSVRAEDGGSASFSLTAKLMGGAP